MTERKQCPLCGHMSPIIDPAGACDTCIDIITYGIYIPSNNMKGEDEMIYLMARAAMVDEDWRLAGKCHRALKGDDDARDECRNLLAKQDVLFMVRKHAGSET